MGNADRYIVTGECLDTTVDKIQLALVGGNWSLRTKNDELEVLGTGWRVEFYESFPGEFLVSAEFKLRF